MCGIAGVISTSGPVPVSVIKMMTDAMSHRGPDGEGHHIEDTFAFGHRRLSIVDLSDAGHQPMIYLDRYVITYNGEIYNHDELRIDLVKAGYRFSGHSDTEVILAAYDCWGPECLKRFNGMWAFVIYDYREKTFFISRDRFGVKPLYFYRNSKALVFASELKAILEHPNVARRINYNYLDKYLSQGPQEYLEETVFEGISKFPKASYAIVTAEEAVAQLQTHLFWSVHTNDSQESFSSEKAAEYAKQYYELLRDAVRIRLKADVKVGSALSGGLDSSSIVYLVNQILKSEGKDELQQTFSSVFQTEETKYCDESYYIHKVIDQLKVKANLGTVDESEIIDIHYNVIKSYESPPDNTCIAGPVVFRVVKSTNVKVTLDGQGADEQLAGYLGYLNTYLTSLSYADFFKEAPHVLKIPRAWKHVVTAFLMLNFRILFGERQLVSTLKRLGFDYETNLNKRLKKDFDTALVNLLHYSDRVSMAYSIESRAPFMDYRLVEFLCSVPACYKIHKGWTKYIARLAFNGKLPDEICWRQDKMGWPSPEEYWFRRTRLRSWFVDTVASSTLVKKLRPELNVERELDSTSMTKMIRFLNIAVFEKIFGK